MYEIGIATIAVLEAVNTCLGYYIYNEYKKRNDAFEKYIVQGCNKDSLNTSCKAEIYGAEKDD